MSMWPSSRTLVAILPADLLSAAGFGADSAAEGLFRRASDAAREHGLRFVARMVHDRADDSIERRFGSSGAQLALFKAMAFSFQPDKAFGFTGDLVEWRA